MDLAVIPDPEKAAIDMTVSMAVEEAARILSMTEEEVFPRFLQSNTCSALYDPGTKLWWEGPSSLAELFLREIA